MFRKFFVGSDTVKVFFSLAPRNFMCNGVLLLSFLRKHVLGGFAGAHTTGGGRQGLGLRKEKPA